MTTFTPAAAAAVAPSHMPAETLASRPLKTRAPATASTRPPSRTHRRSEDGAATVMLVLFVVALLAVAGLVIDGGYALGAKRQAMNTAEQAARAGSDTLSQAALRSGQTRIDPNRASAVAQDYLRRAGATGTVQIDGDKITVTVTGHYDTVLLNAVGLSTLPITATATAVSIDDPDQGRD